MSCAVCGGPMVGSCLARKHRYYGCRHAKPTTMGPATCKSRYIRADLVEPIVWEKIAGVLKDPDVLMSEFKRQLNDTAQGIPARLEKDIKRLTNKLATYKSRERRLVDNLSNSDLQDAILDGLNRLKQERMTDEEQLAVLTKQKQEMAGLLEAEVKLGEFLNNSRAQIDELALEDKRLALDALNIKVITSPEKIDISGVIPLMSTQTSDASSKCNYHCTYIGIITCT